METAEQETLRTIILATSQAEKVNWTGSGRLGTLQSSGVNVGLMGFAHFAQTESSRDIE